MNRATKVGLPGLVAAALLIAAGQSAWADGFLAAGPVGVGLGTNLLKAAGPVDGSKSGFDEATVANGALSKERAGDNITNTDSFKNTITATTTQKNEANFNNNTANGNAGNISFDKAAMDGVKGIGQVVANSAPLGAAQGSIILNVFLNPGAAPTP
jgi:hypothetical protein